MNFECGLNRVKSSTKAEKNNNNTSSCVWFSTKKFILPFFVFLFYLENSIRALIGSARLDVCRCVCVCAWVLARHTDFCAAVHQNEISLGLFSHKYVPQADARCNHKSFLRI